MSYDKSLLVEHLTALNLGASIAEQDNLLEAARVETSAFGDLYNDKIDLVPGTKGSGKSALYRIFVDFLAPNLLKQRKVVVAHGVQRYGDPVFNVFQEHFKVLEESDFVEFWCIYLVSLAHEQFIKDSKYYALLAVCPAEVSAFGRACQRCGIPDIPKQRSLKDILAWTLSVLKAARPRLSYKPPDDRVGEVGVTLFDNLDEDVLQDDVARKGCLPRYVDDIRDALEAVLEKANLNLWLMIDRLDEIFPRRSIVETRALSALLKTMRIFDSSRIRVKVFLRDDILEQVVGSGKGFTGLTHITARAADTLRWSPEQILAMIVRRIFAHAALRDYLGVDMDRLNASQKYQAEAFCKVFPATVHAGKNQSPTLRWIYNHTADGKGVVTPRDVIDLLTRSIQWQLDDFRRDPSGKTDWVIGSGAIRYGLTELSKRKRVTFLQAEFPHLWPKIQKFVGQKTEYGQHAMRLILGKEWSKIAEDLVSIGVLTRTGRSHKVAYKVPFVYREGLELTQGRID